MSFSATVRSELTADLPKSACCRRAMLFGLLAVRGKRTGEKISLTVKDTAVRELCSRLITEQLGREASLVRRTDAVAAYALVFSSGNALNFLIAADEGELNIPEKCGNCRRMFLRGMFLGGGRVSDSQGNFLLEVACGERRALFADLFISFDLAPKCADRRGEKLLYFRQSGAIEDFLALIGANTAAFSLMDRKIAAGIRNEANRMANCDANNIDKSTSAAHRQVALICRLIDENKLSFLPPELVDTARARVEYPSLSLGQLAAVMQPPLTKSGLNHRLARIMEICENLLD